MSKLSEQILNKKYGSEGFEPMMLTLDAEEIIELMDNACNHLIDSIGDDDIIDGMGTDNYHSYKRRSGWLACGKWFKQTLKDKLK